MATGGRGAPGPASSGALYHPGTMNQRADSSPKWHAALLATVYDELAGQNWSQPAQASIEELGLVIGTHPGLKRERNEDRVAAARVRAPNGEHYTLALLCDGVGGSHSGDRAAEHAIACVIAQLAAQLGRPGLKDLATTLVKGADEHVRAVLDGRGATTLVLLLATATGLLVCASVGDSRAYRWDSSADSVVDQVTVDDTIENELKNLPGDHGALLKERGLLGRLSQAVGEEGRTVDELRVQVYTRERFVNGVVLGSDGLWRAAQDFERVVSNASSPADLVRRVLNLATWVGGVDNASAIAIDDLNRFCRPSNQQPALPPDAGHSIVLWTPQLKVKIATESWLGDSGAVSNAATRTKRKNSKPKSFEAASGVKQLSLEPSVTEPARPKLEVTIGETPKK